MLGEVPIFSEHPPNNAAPRAEVYDDGLLHIEYDGYYVECASQPIYDLTRKEFLVLARLARDAGRVVSHAQLWAAVWGADQVFNHRTMRVHVANLRRKLAPYGVEITVVIHLGYRLRRAERHAPA